MSNATAPSQTVSRRLAQAIVTARPESWPAARAIGQRLLMDVAGICIAARHENYVLAALASVEQDGPCNVIGFAQTCGVEAAAFVNGIAAHRRHMTSAPTAMPRSKSAPGSLWRWAAASKAGTMTTPACTGPPS